MNSIIFTNHKLENNNLNKISQNKSKFSIKNDQDAKENVKNIFGRDLNRSVFYLEMSNVNIDYRSGLNFNDYKKTETINLSRLTPVTLNFQKIFLLNSFKLLGFVGIFEDYLEISNIFGNNGTLDLSKHLNLSEFEIFDYYLTNQKIKII
jgi:hypothetical protein